MIVLTEKNKEDIKLKIKRKTIFISKIVSAFFCAFLFFNIVLSPFMPNENILDKKIQEAKIEMESRLDNNNFNPVYFEYSNNTFYIDERGSLKHIIKDKEGVKIKDYHVLYERNLLGLFMLFLLFSFFAFLLVCNICFLIRTLMVFDEVPKIIGYEKGTGKEFYTMLGIFLFFIITALISNKIHIDNLEGMSLIEKKDNVIIGFLMFFSLSYILIYSLRIFVSNLIESNDNEEKQL